MTKERLKKTGFVAWVGICGNLLLALFKGVIGSFAHSTALLADALHTASEALYAFATSRGTRVVRMPSDDDPPNVQARMETFTSIIVAVFMFIIGIQIGISAIKSIYNGVTTPPNEYALATIIAAILLREILYQYCARIKKPARGGLNTSVWKHRTGVYSSLVALAGAGGALLGKLLGLRYFYYLDPLAGLIIGLLILRMAYYLLHEAMSFFSEHAKYPKDTDLLLQTAQRVNGVITVEDLRIREFGHYVTVDVKISVNPRISVIEGNEIAKDLKELLMERFFHITDVNIQVCPYDPGYPYKNNLEIEQKEFSSMLH